MLLVLVQEGCEFEKKLKRPVGDFVKQIVLCYNTDYSTELSSVLQIVVKLLFSFDIGETWDLTTTLKKNRGYLLQNLCRILGDSHEPLTCHLPIWQRCHAAQANDHKFTFRNRINSYNWLAGVLPVPQCS